MDLTRDELGTFARAGGWTEIVSCPHPDKCSATCTGLIGELPSGDDMRHLPDFAHNLQACFDVLERFCDENGLDYYVGRVGGAYYCEMQHAEDEFHAAAHLAKDRPTKQAAIVRAVVAAAKART